MQLDEAERGFSFMRDGRWTCAWAARGPSAADLVNEERGRAGAHLLRLRRGAEIAAHRRARWCAAAPSSRSSAPSTWPSWWRSALGGRRGAPVHPGHRVFQALRIAVNEELGELEAGLRAAERVLAPGEAGGGDLPLAGGPHREELPDRARRAHARRLAPPAADPARARAQLRTDLQRRARAGAAPRPPPTRARGPPSCARRGALAPRPGGKRHEPVPQPFPRRPRSSSSPPSSA
jgi:hypothetical protein